MTDTIGTRIAAARAKRGMTQAELAEAIGTSGVVVCHLETSFRVPSVRRLYDIAAALKTRPSKLLPDSYPDDNG